MSGPPPSTDPSGPATAASGGRAVARERLLYVDWLRSAAFALLVLYHVGMLYVPWHFHVKQQPTHAALEPLMLLTHPWRMSLLFAISGLVTGLMLDRSGLARARSKRLLLPLLLGVAVVVPPQAWLQAREQFGYTGGYADFLRLYAVAYHGFCDGRGCLVLPTWNHLWFLPYLWCYTVLALCARRALPADAQRRFADALSRRAGWPLLVLPVGGLAVLRAVLLPRFGETYALVDDWASHAAYLPVFAFGLLLGRRPALLARLEALRWPALALALAGWAVLVVYPGTLPPGTSPTDPLRWPLRLAHAAAQWGGVVAAFGFARRHLDREARWRAPLAEAVFPLYLVHQTVTIAAAVALRPLALPQPAEALAIVAITFGGGFTAWALARWLGPLRPWFGLTEAGRRAPGGG